jgi:hypothetical protein
VAWFTFSGTEQNAHMRQFLLSDKWKENKETGAPQVFFLKLVNPSPSKEE